MCESGISVGGFRSIKNVILERNTKFGVHMKEKNQMQLLIQD
jgi:hypothetical protein